MLWGGIILNFVLARYYRTEADFLNLCHNLKLTPCPFCKTVGTLILHGKLYGYSENSPCQKACRGQRVLCNKRKTRDNGCGHTSSVWDAATLKRLGFSANSLWKFIKLVLCLGNTAQALRDLNLDFSLSTAYRLRRRFTERQSFLRTALTKYGQPPSLPRERQRLAQTFAHLEAVFPGAPCPITAFQQQLQMSFL